mmetsp:Transcript_79575/g.116644  ORF Transcript_79575/g.116644 Transcript_79575/m.116644 type:complete len:88 (-) Transcript_79575:118-381(-)
MRRQRFIQLMSDGNGLSSSCQMSATTLSTLAPIRYIRRHSVFTKLKRIQVPPHLGVLYRPFGHDITCLQIMLHQSLLLENQDFQNPP